MTAEGTRPVSYTHLPALFWVGIAMIAASALFSIVTLPVEYNASARAMQWLTGSYTLRGEQAAQAKEALSWAARTLSLIHI